MIIHDPKPRRYVKVSKSAVDDPSLSLEALAVLTYQTSRPADWQPRLDCLAGQHRRIGRDKARAIMAELIAAGYAHRRQNRSADGTLFGSIEYIIASNPAGLSAYLLTENQGADQAPENATADQQPGSQCTENPPAILITERILTTEAAAALLTENQGADQVPKNQGADQVPKNQGADSALALLDKLCNAWGRKPDDLPEAMRRPPVQLVEWCTSRPNGADDLAAFIKGRKRSRAAETWWWWIRAYEREGSPKAGSAALKAKDAAPATWIRADDPRWPEAAARRFQKTGKRTRPIPSGFHNGLGFAFENDLLDGVAA